MNFRFFLFLVVILSVVFLGHLSVYFFITSVFTLPALLVRAVGVLTVGLPIFFFGSLILSEWVSNNVFTRAFFRFSAGWLGFFLYLFLAAVFYSIFSFVIPSEVIVIRLGQALAVLAIITAIYGLIHSHLIKVKQINVPIKHLPESWSTKKVVFLSDIHLGQIRGAKFAERIVALINTISPDIVLIGGDVYDGAVGDAEALAEPFKDLHAPLGSYFVMGNHEEFSDNLRFKNALEHHGIKVLEDETINIDGMQIVGVDYKTTVSKSDFKNVLEHQNMVKLIPSILMKHTPAHLDVAEAYGISLSLHGHTHKAQAWPLNIFTHFIFNGYDYGLKKLGKMAVYTSSGIGTWGPPIRVGSDSELVIITFTPSL